MGWLVDGDTAVFELIERLVVRFSAKKWIFVTSSEKTSLSHYCRMAQSVPLMVFYLSSFTFYFTITMHYTTS